MNLEDVCLSIIDCEHKTAPSATSADAGYGKVVGTRDLVDGRIAYATARSVTEETYQRWTVRGTPCPDDLILAREAPVGPVARVQPNQRVCLGQRTVLLRPNRKLVDPAYLHYLLLSPEMQGLMASQAGGSTVAHLNVSDIRALPLPPLPPLATQQGIANFMALMDQARSAHEEKQQALDNLLLRAFSSIPCADAASLADLADFKYGKALKASNRRGGSVPVYASAGLVGWHDEALTTGAGVIVGRKGNAGATFWSDRPSFVIDTAYYVVPIAGRVSPAYLYYLLRSLRLERLGADSAVPGLSRSVALGLEVEVAAPDDVERFTSLAEPVLAALGASVAAARSLAATRNILLPELVNGRLSVDAAYDLLEEVAS